MGNLNEAAAMDALVRAVVADIQHEPLKLVAWDALLSAGIPPGEAAKAVGALDSILQFDFEYEVAATAQTYEIRPPWWPINERGACHLWDIPEGGALEEMRTRCGRFPSSHPYAWRLPIHDIPAKRCTFCLAMASEEPNE